MATETLPDQQTDDVEDSTEDGRYHDPLAWPASAVNPVRIRWRYAISIPLIHLLACLAFLPAYFSWTGVVICVLGFYVFGTLGINLCYHRLLTHQGFVAPKWLEHGLALLGVCTMQDSPACWVAMHRMHHKYSDTQPDPHSPLVNFLWGHCGWLVFVNRDFRNVNYYEKFVRDLLRDPFYLKLERNSRWTVIYAIHALLFFAVGWAIGGVPFGLSLLVWGVFVRTVVVWHITWSINSVTHVWGYQNYDTREHSRNNMLVALWSNGEGWHNNHHADQRAASHGHKWWEFDLTWQTVRLLELLGLAKEVVRPRCWGEKSVGAVGEDAAAR